MTIARGVGPATGVVADNTTVSVNLAGTTAGRQVILRLIQTEAGEGIRTISSVTVGGQAATVINGVTGPGGLSTRHSIAYLSELSSGGDKTCTLTVTGGNQFGLGITAQEYSGGETAGFYDAGTFNSTTGTNDVAASVDCTPTVNNALIVGVVVCGSSGTIVAGSAYSLVTPADSGAFANDRVEDDLDGGAAGVRAVDATFPFSTEFMICAAAFVAASEASPLNAGAESAYLPGGLQPQTELLVISKW